MAKRNGEPYAKVRLRFTIERKIDLAGLRNNFLFHTKNEERNEVPWDGGGAKEREEGEGSGMNERSRHGNFGRAVRSIATTCR